MTEAKKDLLKNVILTIGGLLPATIFSNSQNWFIKIIQIIGILCSGLNVILIFVNLQYFVDDIFPTKTFDDKAKSTIDKTIIILVNALFLIGAVAMIFETKKIDNTICGLKFFWTCGAIGIVTSFLFIFLVSRISKTIYKDSTRRYTILLGLPLGFMMLFPATLNFINRQFANPNVYEVEIKIDRKSTDSRGRARYLFCTIADNEERFEVSRNIYENIEEGEELKLRLQKGIFGFEIVKEFKTNN